MAGHPLKLTGAACLGVLSCGPDTVPPTGDGDGSGSSGYALTGTSSATSTSTSSTATTSAPETTTTSAPETTTSVDDGSSSGSSSTGEAIEPCDYPGDLCGEFSVCSCSCDVLPDCCECTDAVCTVDGHCDGDDICEDVSSFGAGVWLQCVPPACEGAGFEEASPTTVEEAMAYEGVACLGTLGIALSSLVDLSQFASLEYIQFDFYVALDSSLLTLSGLEALRRVNVLEISGNTALSNIDALSGLEQIVSGGQITDNPNLDRAQIDAVLAGVDGGAAVMVCGNLNDIPC